MTPEHIAQAIATHCGWDYDDGEMFATENGEIVAYLWPSLDAMHAAVMTLNRDTLDYSNYCSHLNQIVAISNSQQDTRPIQACDATAAQRAEAFLKTLNLWQPWPPPTSSKS